MKKLKLLSITIICILLTACTNEPPPLSNKDNINNESQRLSNVYEYPKVSPKKTGNEENNSISGDNNPTLNDTNLVEAGFDEDKNVNIKTSNKPILATYSSKVYTKTEDRQKNLRIVCEKLSGTILKPNEEFSYNDTCGPYNKENGFGKATVFMSDGTEMQDYGGGVCQLSSTLYNAIKNLNVEVTERHNHSKKVYYVPDGEDATVSYGNLDFKFKNLNDYSLLFEAFSNADKVQVNVYKA